MRRLMLTALVGLLLMLYLPVSAQQGSTYYVNVRAAKVRAEPKTTATLITTLAKGKSVTVLEVVTGEKVGSVDKWYKININGKSGYILSSLVSDHAPEITAAQNQASVEPTAFPTAQSANTTTKTKLPPNGQWIQNPVATTNTCNPNAPKVSRGNSILKFSEDGGTLSFNPRWKDLKYALSRVSENVYQGVFDNGQLTITITFTSRKTSKLSWVEIYGDPNNGGCTFNVEYDGVFLI